MTAVPAPPRRRAARAAIAIAYLVAFSWQLLGAISNLRAWTGFAALVGRGLSSFAWIVLIVGLLIPVACFALGLLIGRRGGPGGLAAVLLVALCASEALTLSQLAFFEAGVGSP